MCFNWPKIPINMKRATSGLIGNTVMICGGGSGIGTDKCYSLTSEKTILVTHMSRARVGAASIVLNDNTLWVTGGYYIHSGHTEYVTMTETIPGPDFPFPAEWSFYHSLEDHAMVAINNSCTMFIGGGYYVQYTYATTFSYLHDKGEWIHGPK